MSHPCQGLQPWRRNPHSWLQSHKNEKTKFWSIKEVFVTLFFGIGGDPMPWSPSAAWDNKRFPTLPKSFVRVRMPAEKESTFPALNIRISKILFRFLVRPYHLTVRKRWSMATDDKGIYCIVTTESHEFALIPSALCLDLSFCHCSEIWVNYDVADVFPREAVPPLTLKMGKTFKIILKSCCIITVKLMITLYRKVGNLFFSQ